MRQSAPFKKGFAGHQRSDEWEVIEFGMSKLSRRFVELLGAGAKRLKSSFGAFARFCWPRFLRHVF